MEAMLVWKMARACATCGNQGLCGPFFLLLMGVHQQETQCLFFPLDHTPKADKKKSYWLHLAYQGEPQSEGRASGASSDESQMGNRRVIGPQKNGNSLEPEINTTDMPGN